MAKLVGGVNGSAFGSYASAGIPGTAQVAFAPVVPASTTPVANPSTLTLTVVITGGTLTQVIVNGVQVGSAPGTYTVPGQGSISITYSAAPTWAWSYAPVFQAALNANGTPVSRTGVN